MAWTSQPVVNSAGAAQATGFVQVASGIGARHACALAAGKTMWCWGYGYSGELGDGNGYHGEYSPVQVAISDGMPLTGVRAISLGGRHSCAALEDGRAMCWGADDIGQLGNGPYGSGSAWAQPVLVDATTSLTHVTSIAAGVNHGCALLDTGEVRCWGESGNGETGSGRTDRAEFAVPVVIDAGAPLSDVIQIASGDMFSCAVKRGGALWCWGANGSGQLGDTTSVNRLSAVAAATSVGPIAQVACGGIHTCAIAQTGALWCWGGNTYGQIGNDTTVNQLLPVQAIDDGKAPLAEVAQVRAGLDFTCAANSAGALWCWGANTYGQLGRSIDPSVYLKARTVALGCP